MNTVSSLGERALIDRITARLVMPSWVAVGPGDDAAVVIPRRGTHDVFTTDALVDSVHFDRRFVPPDAIGHRALAVNLSDLAAMGAEPRAALLSLILPGSAEVADVDAIVGGMLALADDHGVALAGGNITSTPGPLVVDVTAIGSIHPRRVLLRRGARPGDEVYVTGTLGDAAVGLMMLQVGPEDPPLRRAVDGDPAEPDLQVRLTPDRCIDRYLRPQPRVRAGLLLGRNRVPTSCMDLSDGLADGLRQIAETSGVGITIDAAALPVSDESQAWHAALGRSAVDTALAGGDDYELLFTVRPSHRGRLRGVRNRLGGLPVTRIGVVTRSRELLVQDGSTTRPLPAGFEHFR